MHKNSLSDSTKLTMKDIAELAGVSRITVSRYINGGYVSEEKRAVIKNIIEESNFFPNIYAQSLKKNINAIGITLPCIGSESSLEVLRGIIDESKELGCRVIFNSYEHDNDTEYEILNDYENLRIRGMISFTGSPYPGKIEKFKKFENCLVVGHDIYHDIKCIYYDHDASVSALFDNVVFPMCRFIKKIRVLTDSKLPGKKRLLLGEFGIKTGLDFKEIPVKHCVSCDMGFVPEKDTLYICQTDQIAINMYPMADKYNMCIGGDFYVCGFGNYSIGTQLNPSLTTVEYMRYDYGREAVKLLLCGEVGDIRRVGHKVIIRNSANPQNLEKAATL